MPSEIQVIKSYFKSKHLHVSEYFIECCLEWVRSQFNINTEKELCEKVYEQWLLTDLRQIGERSLPPNISKQKTTTIQGNFAVQIMYLKDISKSSLSQLKVIRNMYKLTRSNIDQENEPQGKRVLYFQITDGVEYIFAFEYETVPCLNLNLTPGVKILLIGPLTIRNGEILLKKNNVKVLGGEVDDILVCNAVENVLARELNLPENPNPGKIESQIITENNQNVDNTTTNNYNTTYNTRPANVNRNNENIPVFEPEPSTSNINQINDFDDDDLIMAQISVPDEYEQKKTEVNNEDFGDEFMDFEINEQLEQIDQEIQSRSTYPVKVTSEPFNYIKQIIDNREQLLDKTVKVKAQFIAVVQKLSFSSSRGWTMKFKITDGTGVIVVDFLSAVLEELFGVTFEQALVLKEKVKNKVIEAFERIEQLICECKDKLTLLNCFMGLKFNGQTEIATVVWLKPVSPRDLFKLKQRLDTFNNS